MATWTCGKCTFENVASNGPLVCQMCHHQQIAVCSSCSQEIRFGARVFAAGKTYHQTCFRCMACHQPLGSSQFQMFENEPYHVHCYRELFHPKCDVCGDQLPIETCSRHTDYNADGSSSSSRSLRGVNGSETTSRIVFKEIPFWQLRYCAKHEECARCTSCNRLETNVPSKRFETLVDGRKTCQECAMSIVLDTQEAQQAVREVWSFMESLGMPLPPVPVYLVDFTALNEHHHTRHGQTAIASGLGFRTRGICLSEMTQVRHVMRSPNNLFVPQVVQLKQRRSVTAILILHGLAYELTASVLAHEATHAFIKLHEQFPSDLPAPVEEGLCQLISFLFLRYKQVVTSDSGAGIRARANSVGDNSSFVTKLRQYLLFQIQNDTSHVYGDGFRLALNFYEVCDTFQQFMDHVRTFRSFG